MMQPADKRLIIFDYSGTLSLESPCFAQPKNLARALDESGLADVGVTDADIFWGKVVFPVWDEGSRTTIGYAKVMADRIASLRLPLRGCDAEGTAPCPQGAASSSPIARAAKRFVAMYLGHSQMDPLWRPLLEKLNADKQIVIVIATDHYAETTSAIIRYLWEWGIVATKAEGIVGIKQPAKEGVVLTVARERALLPEGSAFSLPAGKYEGMHGQGNGEERFSPVIVANSADLGFWKADRRFWEILKGQLTGSFRSVLIVDDFGFNEADANGYANLSRVRDRRVKTTSVLRDVFQTSVSTISFFLKNNEGDRKEARTLKIRKTIRRIEATMYP